MSNKHLFQWRRPSAVYHIDICNFASYACVQIYNTNRAPHKHNDSNCICFWFGVFLHASFLCYMGHLCWTDYIYSDYMLRIRALESQTPETRYLSVSNTTATRIPLFIYRNALCTRSDEVNAPNARRCFRVISIYTRWACVDIYLELSANTTRDSGWFNM